MKLLLTITEPITLAEAKLHCKMDNDLPGPSHTEDALLVMLISAARQQAEAIMWQKIPEQTWETYLQAWPASGVIDLPAPLSAVAGVYYTPDGGIETTFADVVVDLPGNRVLLKTGESWPSDTLRQVNPIRVQFTAKMDPVPADVKIWMLLFISTYYAHRETMVIGGSIAEMPGYLRNLLPSRLEF